MLTIAVDTVYRGTVPGPTIELAPALDTGRMKVGRYEGSGKIIAFVNPWYADWYEVAAVSGLIADTAAGVESILQPGWVTPIAPDARTVADIANEFARITG